MLYNNKKIARDARKGATGIMNHEIKWKNFKKGLCTFLTIALIFTMSIPMTMASVNAESSGSADAILKLDEQAPAGLANAKNPYGYPEGVPFSLSKGNELMYYGGWNGSTERKMLNGSSVSDLEGFVKAPNKGTSDSSPVPSGTWNWVKAVAFDYNADSTKEDRVLFVGVEKNQKAYAWVLDYSTNKVSETLELGNMDWIGYDYDQYSSTSLFQVAAGDFDGDGIDTLLVYAENNLEELYDEHDGEVFSNDLSAWTKDYLAEQMVNVVTNFSKERVEFLKNICKHLYSARAEKIENERRTENSQKIQVTRKQVGTGLAIAGVASAVVGIAISKPLVIGVGVAAAVAGGVLIVTDK